MSINKTIRLAIIGTHPIQYYAPVFKLLARKITLMVFYTKHKTFDIGFQQIIQWDIPLLEGYECIQSDKCILKKIKAFNPDHILIYGWANFSHLLVMMHFKGKIPILFRGDSTLLLKKSLVKKICRKLVLQFIYKHIDKALYVGKNNKNYFKEFGLQEAQLVFAPHAIDNVRFAAIAKLNIRDRLKIGSDDLLILYTGKFEPIKNPELLLHAFIELQLPNTHLLFTGDGRLRKKLKIQSQCYTNIHFLPFQNQSKMPAIYQACDLFCMPSNGDSWGLAVNEAMAAGKAILVSDQVGSAADLVQQENGRIFKHNNLEDLKKNLLEMVTDITELQQKGRNSLKIIANWNFKTQAKNILHAVGK